MKWIRKASTIIALMSVVSATMLSGNHGRAEAAAETEKAKMAAQLESVSTSGEGDSTELLLKFTSAVTYTSYKTSSPTRIVLDASQATQGTVAAPVEISKGNFKRVQINRFDTDAGTLLRFEIELAADMEPVVTASSTVPGELRIGFAARSGQQAEVKAAAGEPGLSAASNAATPAVAQEAGVAVLKNIATKGSDKIVLSFEGAVADYKTFKLNKPERFVVDLTGAKSALSSRLISLNAAGVSSARVGLYPDKLRVVFDAVNGSIPEPIITKEGNDLLIAITATGNTESTTGKDVVTAPPVSAVEKHADVAGSEKRGTAAPSETVAATPKAMKREVTDKPAVESVDFQVVDGISRVAVRVAGEAAVAAPVKSPGMLTLTVKNARIAKHLQRSLETQTFASPVFRVTPFPVKSKGGTDVKVKIALRAPATSEFRKEGDVYIVDIKPVAGNAVEKLAEDDFTGKVSRGKTEKAAARDADISSDLAPVAAPEPVAKGSELPGKAYKGRKVTLEFADAEVRKIFQLLSEVSNKNFVLGDDVTGTISLKLVNVPWDQALDIILDTKNLDKREEGNIILIKAKGKFKSQAEEEQEIKKAINRTLELKTETFSVNYADTNTISQQFANLKSDRGNIAQDTRTNKVIVKDIPQALDDMRKLLVQLDVPEKQVMIEARIVEATSTFTNNLGVSWGVHYRDGSASFLGINKLDTSFGGLTTAAVTSGQSGQPGGNMGISFGTLTSNIQLDMRLNAAASAGQIKIVSTPKVATLNNKTAKITQGQQIPYTSSTSDKVETKFVEAALALEVTPHINANGTIGLKIDAKNDAPGSGGNPPPINKKQATTEMLLRDGETTVIGGIYVDNETENDDGVPYLMDIPFIGKLFKSNTKSKTKTELLIFITPRILSGV